MYGLGSYNIKKSDPRLRCHGFMSFGNMVMYK